jgi:hypothetical protein
MIILKQSKNLKEAKELIVPDGFEKVNVLSWHGKDTKYYEMSPYHLKTEDGFLFENWYQSRKIYPTVYPIVVKPNFRSNIVWWEYDSQENHCVNGVIQPEYFKWCDLICRCPNPIRYPNGYSRRGTVLFSLYNNQLHDYISSRYHIYFLNYSRIIRQLPIYSILLNKIRRGENICITEVDVPAHGKRGLYSNVDQNGYFYPTLQNLDLLLRDPSEAFGHALCLTICLLEDLR